jgi:hypothetical protein
MNKRMLLLVGSMLLVGVMVNAYADNIITYGKSTYAQVGDKIIFGSLGDEYAVSEFGNLGANDWIPENSFKNVLGYEGYTEAYDYNPAYDGYYDSFYKTPLPLGKDLVAVEIAGLGANPREIQKVWVLRSEYERLNAGKQADRMDTIEVESKDRDTILQDNINIEQFDRIQMGKDLQNNIDNETTSRVDADNNLGKRITKETNQRKTADTKLNNKINKEISQRKTADIKLDNKITKETTARKQADKQEKQERIAGDKKLHKEITTETKDRKSADKTLQKNINTETKDRKSEDKLIRKDVKRVEKESKKRDNVLQDNIDSEALTRFDEDTKLGNKIVDVDDRQTAWNNRQDTTLQDHESRINNLDGRVSKLEKTQYVAEAEFRVYDDKHLTISPFLRHNFTRSKTDTIGVRFTIKLGESYEEKEIAKTNARLDNTEARLSKIEEKLVQPAYIEKTITKNLWGKTTKTSFHITAQPIGVKVEKKF